jgi:hypothetical protein
MVAWTYSLKSCCVQNDTSGGYGLRNTTESIQVAFKERNKAGSYCEAMFIPQPKVTKQPTNSTTHSAINNSVAFLVIRICSNRSRSWIMYYLEPCKTENFHFYCGGHEILSSQQQPHTVGHVRRRMAYITCTPKLSVFAIRTMGAKGEV